MCNRCSSLNMWTSQTAIRHVMTRLLQCTADLQLAVKLSSFEYVDGSLTYKMTQYPTTDNHAIHQRHCITNPSTKTWISTHITTEQWVIVWLLHKKYNAFKSQNSLSCGLRDQSGSWTSNILCLFQSSTTVKLACPTNNDWTLQHLIHLPPTLHLTDNRS